MKVENFDQNVTEKVERDVRSAMEKVAKKYGISIQLKPGRTAPELLEAKLTLGVVHDDGLAETKELRKLREKEPKLAGRMLEIEGTKFRAVGFRPRAKNLPILIEEQSTGKKFAISREDASAHLA